MFKKLNFILIISYFLVVSIHTLADSKDTPLLFIPGGPGFGANPEKNMLFPFLQSLGYAPMAFTPPHPFNQNTAEHFPAFRPYQIYLEKLTDTFARLAMEFPHKKWVICGHSFAVHPIIFLAKKFPSKIKKIILISPGLDLESADKRILNLAYQGFMTKGQWALARNDLATARIEFDKADKLKNYLDHLLPGFGQDKIAAYTLASEYQELFSHYWVNPNTMLEYFSFLTGEHAFDPNAFMLLRKDLAENPITLTLKPINIKTEVFFGQDDPVIGFENEIHFLKNKFRRTSIRIVPNSKHYSHIENKEIFQ